MTEYSLFNVIYFGVQLVLYLACLYTLILICKAKETRLNGYLIAITGCSLIYSASWIALVIIHGDEIVLPSWDRHVYFDGRLQSLSAYAYLSSHWIFQGMLFKSALLITEIAKKSD